VVQGRGLKLNGEGMNNRSNEIGKTRVLSPEEMEKGICPQCAGELFIAGGMCIDAVVYIRWECKSCTFVAKIKVMD
jgi:RNase P subunit RPR2